MILIILGILGFIITLVNFFLTWIKRGHEPGPVVRERMAKVRNRLAEFNKCCDQFGVAPSADLPEWNADVSLGDVITAHGQLTTTLNSEEE